MSVLDVPRLYRNRCGVWCFRLRSGARDQRVSLGTKCPLTAHMIASKINAAVSSARAREHGMTGKNPTLDELGLDLAAARKYEIDLRAGVVRTDGSADDHERAMQALRSIGELPRELFAPGRGGAGQPPGLAAAPARTPMRGSKSLATVAAAWIAERRQKNKPRTVYAKECHYANFIEHLAATADMAAFDQAERAAFKKKAQNDAKAAAESEGKPFRKLSESQLDALYVARKTTIDALGKRHAVDFKAALLASGQKAKTVDNKLLTLGDLFDYAMGNGEYSSEDGKNPISGTYILSRKERTEQAEPYQPFTPEEIAAIFEPESYKSEMADPDLYWCPLIALHSGMRISEATGIHVEDVRKSPNGVDVIHVRKSKTGAGIRDVPIAQALIDLGFLDFVAAQRAGGHERIFPDRKLINDSYSKELGIAFRERLLSVGVRKLADKTERKSFHSFRVNVITQLTDNGANTVQIMRVVGHSTASAQALSTHMGYVRELPSLKAVVDGLAWRIDLASLRK